MAKHVRNVPNVRNTNIVLGQHSRVGLRRRRGSVPIPKSACTSISLKLCLPGTMFVFGTFRTCGTFGTFGTCLAPDRSEHVAQVSKNLAQITQNHQKLQCCNLGMSVLIWVSNRDVQRSNRLCSQDQHAQAQHWLRQAQLMHVQHWPRTKMRTRQGRAAPPPLALKSFGSLANAEHA